MSEIPQPDPTMIPGEANDGNPDYIENHPNAIQDPELAHYMANASQESEDSVTQLAKYATTLMDAYNKGGRQDVPYQSILSQRKNYDDNETERLEHKEIGERADKIIEAAERSRQRADAEAEDGRKSFEKAQYVNSLASGKSPSTSGE